MSPRTGVDETAARVGTRCSSIFLLSQLGGTGKKTRTYSYRIRFDQTLSCLGEGLGDG
nr:hypothetical protein [uncultured bacterium]